MRQNQCSIPCVSQKVIHIHKIKYLVSFLILAREKQPIKITLPDGKEVEGLSWKTTPYEVAQGIRY